MAFFWFLMFYYFTKLTRYYALEIKIDLFDVVVVKHYGRINTRLGQTRTHVFESHDEAHEFFSKLLKQAIQQAKEMFDAPVKQYLLFADFEEQVKERNVEGLLTDRFAELDPKIKRHVQAYFGLFLKHLDDGNSLSEDERFDYAMQIDDVVTASVAEFSINPQKIENQIRRKLLPVLFKAIGMDTAKVVIADIIQITRLGAAGHH